MTVERQELDNETACLLHRIFQDWVPMPARSRLPTRIQWDKTDLSGLGTELRASKERLSLELQARALPAEIETLDGPLAGKSLSGLCDDGSTFSADDVIPVGMKSTWSNEVSTRRLTLEGHQWSVVGPGRPPRLWVGEVKGEAPEGIGNLVLATEHSGSSGHYLLKGARLTYHVLNAKRPAGRRLLLVVDGDGVTPSHEDLHPELTLLGFVMGQPLAVDELAGVDEKALSVAAMGGPFGVAPEKPCVPRSPVPQRDHRHAWCVPFFERLAAYQARVSSGERRDLTLAIWYYLDSLNERSADGAQLKMFLGLVAAARHTLGGPPFVVDEERWGQFLAAGDDALRAITSSGYPSVLSSKCSRP